MAHHWPLTISSHRQIKPFSVYFRLASQLSSLEKSIKEKQEQKQKLEDKLSSLQPSLERLRAATVPLQEFFQMPLDWEREQYQLATYLPL